jgi:hypothetical protein
MSVQLLTEAHPIATVAVLALAAASVLKLLIKERARNTRLNAALKDSRPSQRPEIILAASRFEGATAGETPGADTAEGGPAAHKTGQPAVQVDHANCRK